MGKNLKGKDCGKGIYQRTGLRTGEPAKNSSYDTHLYKLCDEAGINRFCMHALRHTY